MFLLPFLALLAPPDPRLARVDELVRAEMARQKVPGVAVAIVQRGTVVKAEGYGFANVEHRVPVTPETIFQSGSLGKQFTAAAVMTLVEAGQVGLDDSIAKYFPEAPAAFKPITVRHLLTHTSGIPDYTGGTIDFRKDYTEDDLAKLGDDLTIVVLANLAEADPQRFIEGIAAIFNPALARRTLTVIPDREPDVTTRVRALLAAARDAKLSPADFAYVRAGFFPDAPSRYARLLSRLGDPARLDLLERRELGDDRVYTYDVVYEKQTLRLVIAIAPDGKLAQFSSRRRE